MTEASQMAISASSVLQDFCNATLSTLSNFFPAPRRLYLRRRKERGKHHLESLLYICALAIQPPLPRPR